MSSQNKDQIKQHMTGATNILVAVSSNPTVDELAASIGLTLALNKMEKHATTVFSGSIPSTIEFLEPEQTIEKNTDSLRDFIIALDKSKADKLRYKVEDDVVRIFITPYRTSITQDDLDFTQGDFNVDLVIGLGVERREDLDKAITAHGRILHDATVVSISSGDKGSELGSIHWQEPSASSLCEMIAVIIAETGQDLFDEQMSTALLTGIVAETDRFKNPNTTPLALSMSSTLMASGANQQLIAEKLEEPVAPAQAAPAPVDSYDSQPSAPAPVGDQPFDPAPAPANDSSTHPAYAHDDEQPAADGSLSINHVGAQEPSAEETPQSEEQKDIHIDEHGTLNLQEEQASPPAQEELKAIDKQDSPEPALVPMPPQIASAYADDDDDAATPATESAPKESSSGYISPDQQSDEGKKDDQDINEAPSKDGTHDESPSLDQPKTDTPIMKHERVIAPAADSELAEKSKLKHSDKPFDLTQAEDTPGIVPQLQPSSPEPVAPKPAEQTLSALEQSVDSHHVSEYASPDTQSAMPSVADLSAKASQAADAVKPQFPSPQEAMQSSAPLNVQETTTPTENKEGDAGAPPPVPPPMAPQFFDSDGKPEPS